MKGFVVLAALLLVPTMAYFQTQCFERELQGELQAGLETLLAEGGVQDARVGTDWLDATISGMVGAIGQRESLAEMVEARDGVRMARGGNQLEVRGWLKLVREDGVLTVSGLLPTGGDRFLGFIGDGTPRFGELQGEVRRAEWVAPPAEAMEWNEFVRVFLDGPGNREVELRDGWLSIGGDVTPEMRTVWLAKGAAVVGEDGVVDRLEVRASLREFEGLLPEGISDVETLRRLREALGGAAVAFARGSAEVVESERGKVLAAAAAIAELGGTAVFLIEGLSGEDEDQDLAAARAGAVRNLMLEHGVRPEQLEVVAFGPGEGKNPGQAAVISVK